MKDEFKINVIKNKSTTYMLPFVDEKVSFKFIEKILNSYLSFEPDDNLFCILYDWTADQDFLKFENDMMNHELYSGHEDYGDKCLYKFKLTKEMLVGRNLLVDKKHSEFSDNHKLCIRDYLIKIKATNVGSIMKILDPNEEKESVHPSMYNETFINHLKVTRVKTDKLYEGNKKKWTFSELQPKQNNI